MVSSYPNKRQVQLQRIRHKLDQAVVKHLMKQWIRILAIMELKKALVTSRTPSCIKYEPIFSPCDVEVLLDSFYSKVDLRTDVAYRKQIGPEDQQ